MATTQARVLRACYSFLVPVAKFLLRAGVSYREFDDLARTAFVDVAALEFGLRGRQTNTSRISAMTGIPRKEVKRIRETLQPNHEFPRRDLSPIGDILHHWYTDSRFLSADGQPLALHLDETGPSFEDLARLCAGDLPVGALKVELLRLGAASVKEDGLIHALKRVAVPDAFDDKLITSLSFNLFGLASTIAFNSDPGRKSEGRIERFVQSDDISDATRGKLRPLIRRRIESFTEDLDDMFSAVDGGSQGDGRLGVGIYYYEEDKPK
jgi:hypothetical protein